MQSIVGHYTSAAALINIIATGKLWASNIKFLNDEEEFAHAINLSKEIIERSKEKSKSLANISLYQEYVERIISSLNTLDRYDSDTVFTISFSQEMDQLSQWRGYCQNNLGYCLKFKKDDLLKKIRKSFPKSEFYSCVYDSSSKYREIASTLNNHWSTYATTTNNKEKNSVIDSLISTIKSLAAHFKNNAFKEEKEDRVVIMLPSISKGEIKFRPGSTSIIPYIEVPFDQGSLTGVVIGPTRNKQLAEKGIETLLEQYSGFPSYLHDIKLEQSKVPYRT